MTDYTTTTCWIDGKPVEVRVPVNYGKPRRRKVHKIEGSPLAAAIAKGRKLSPKENRDG